MSLFPVRSFVRRNSRTTDAQKRALSQLWAQYGLNLTEQPLDLNAAFGRDAEKHLEIGFGRGDALRYFAQQFPQHDYIGIDIHLPGAGTLLRQLDDDGSYNVRIFTEDAIKVLTQSIAPHSLDRVYVLFPDPWHKKRHHKRRLVQTPFVDLIASRLKIGGEFHLATDWEHYAWQMLETIEPHPDFRNLMGPRCFTPRNRVDRPITKFEQRGHCLGHSVWDLRYVRR